MHAVLLVAFLVSQSPKDDQLPRTHAELLREVAKSIREAPRILEPADFQINDQFLYYRFGGLRGYADVPLTDPQDVPILTQFRVESIRRYPGWGPSARKTWEKSLSAVEAIISKELALIAKHQGNETQLLNDLANYRRETEDILLATITAFSRKERRQLAALPPAETKITQKLVTYRDACGYMHNRAVFEVSSTENLKYRITLAPEPYTNDVHFLPDTDYALLVLRKKVNDIDRWKHAQPVNLWYGEIWLRAEFPDGRAQLPSLYDFDHDQVLPVSPTPPRKDRAK